MIGPATMSEKNMSHPTADELEDMVSALEASGDYRIKRRLKPRPTVVAPTGTDVKKAIFVDVETTGLDFERDEIIELAVVPFNYGTDGQIYSVEKPFHSFRQPSKPIPATVTKLTGITDGMVAGRSIDTTELDTFAADARLVVAHNAAFDRRFVERLASVFQHKPWACSQSQIDWASEGYEGTRLSHLVAEAGLFYDKHRAVNDCLAAIELLACPLPSGPEPAMKHLLDAARQPSWRIWAENSPFEFKDILKARGYRWNGDGSTSPKAWYVDVSDTNKLAELDFLKSEIYQGEIELLSQKIDAYNRFSNRV